MLDPSKIIKVKEKKRLYTIVEGGSSMSDSRQNSKCFKESKTELSEELESFQSASHVHTSHVQIYKESPSPVRKRRTDDAKPLKLFLEQP